MEINATILGQLLTFLVLIVFTRYFVWPKIITVMHEREKKIAAGLEASDRGKRELEKAEHKILEILRTAKQEASLIVDQAHKRAAQILEEAQQEARTESKRILEQADSEIGREVTKAKETLRKEFASLAIVGAEKIIQRQINASDQAAFLDKLAAEI